jgi:pantoate--beta-alanine ligase
MEIYNTVAALQQHLYQHSRFGKKIGFVPTMGALHEGHLTLVLDALEENDIVVCSIFVNPTQFNDPNDLKKYPRPIEKDIQMLESVGCQILFLPEVEEIYPPTLVEPEFDLNGLDLPMEGAKRPGHFQGVVRVVYRLLDIVKPDSLYMGQKDFQQYAIIAQMLRQMNSGIRLLRVPIVRETDGLAMSSRNVRLSKEGRKLAPVLYKVLQEVEYYVNSQPFPIPKKATELAMGLFQQHGIEHIDYFEIVDAETLHELHSFEDSNFAVVCAVIVIDGVRLLDNVILFEK